MNRILRQTAQKIGIDKSIAYSSSARIVQALAGVVSIFFITRYLTGVEQGFYYTFGSIVAIQVFFELGLTTIITQYVAHEASHLEWKTPVVLLGEERYRSRLASLLHFSVKWYSIISAGLFILLLLIGYLFFSNYAEPNLSVSWKIPWLLISVGTAINLFVAPLLSLLMGLGKVKEVSRISFYRQLIIPVFSWIGLIIGFRLYVIGIGSILSALLVIFIILRTDFKEILLNLWRISITEKVSYMKEIFPYQWKIALSWVSGYFIFQLFNPVLFATEGAIVAGQMGMTLVALNGIQALSMSWLNTKVPLYSRLIALKEYALLDSIFQKTLKQMSFVCGILLLIMLAGIYTIRTLHISFGGNLLGDRFLSYGPLILMIIPLFLNQFVNSWATYLRCHKKEPFLIISICCGISCCLSTILLGKYFGVAGVTMGYCMITILFFPWEYWIYKTKKEKWHEE